MQNIINFLRLKINKNNNKRILIKSIYFYFKIKIYFYEIIYYIFKKIFKGISIG